MLPAAAEAANRGWSRVTSGSDAQASVSLVRTASTRVPHAPDDPSSKRTVYARVPRFVTTTTGLAPSRKATTLTAGSDDVAAIRTAPGRTKREYCPIA